MGQSLHVQASHFPALLHQRKIKANTAIVIITVITLLVIMVESLQGHVGHQTFF